MKAIFALLLSVLALPAQVLSSNAADLPVKAAPRLTTVYPAASGFYFGIGTQGGGGTVDATINGVNAASLVTNQISLNGIVGYAWNVPNSQMFAAVEGWVGWNNFNGDTPGFSFSGPLTTTTRLMVGAPLSDIMGLFPTLPISVPVFPPLPNGQVATNIKPYISFDSHIDDVTLDIVGMGSNRDWRWAPGLSVGALGQLSSGSVVDVAAMVAFPQKGICVGPALPALQPCGVQSTTYKALLALKW